MNYFKFKKLYHETGHGSSNERKLKPTLDFDFSFETQGLFDFIFDELIKNNKTNPPIPFWAMAYYNDFVRVMEDKSLTLIQKVDKIELIRTDLIEEAAKIIGIDCINTFLTNQKAA